MTIQTPTHAAPLGAFPGAQGTTFRLWSTRASRAAVVLYEQGRPQAPRPLRPLGEGLFEAHLNGVRPGARYTFALDGQPLPDPYARWLPEGVHGPAEVWQPGYRFRHPSPALRRRDLVIYELHVGTFTPEGTYRAAREKLGQLRDLGVNGLELMPLASFPGRWGWGYDGVAPFAPFAGYGPPEDLMELIDEAHGLGMVVLLDLVLNHFGPDGNYLGAYSPEYFTHAFKTPWGDALNYPEPHMRRLALDSAEHWLRAYRVDGFRLDATHEIYDDSPKHLLTELAEHVHNLCAPAPGNPSGSNHFLFCEDDRNEPALVTQTGMDGLWADDFHHQVQVLLTGEQDGYYSAYRPEVAELARCIQQGWLYQGQDWPLGEPHPRGAKADGLPAESFVYCIQNHDQIGNRALGDRLQEVAGEAGFLAASTLLLFLPMTPLLFQGQEWMASSRFGYFSDHGGELGALVSEGRLREFAHFEAFTAAMEGESVPDPQAEGTFRHSALNWAEREQGEHARALELYRQLLRLRQHDPVMQGSGRGDLRAGHQGELLWVTRTHGGEARVLLLNFGAAPAPFPELPGLPLADAELLVASAVVSGDRLPPKTAVILQVKQGAAGPDPA